jgi:hypothetical protein
MGLFDPDTADLLDLTGAEYSGDSFRAASASPELGILIQTCGSLEPVALLLGSPAGLGRTGPNEVAVSLRASPAQYRATNGHRWPNQRLRTARRKLVYV